MGIGAKHKSRRMPSSSFGFLYTPSRVQTLSGATDKWAKTQLLSSSETLRYPFAIALLH